MPAPSPRLPAMGMANEVNPERSSPKTYIRFFIFKQALSFASKSDHYMKRIYLFLLAGFSGFHALAQPVIDTSYHPKTGYFFSGKSFELTSGLTLATGPNVSWNLDTLDNHYTDTIRLRVIDPATSPGAPFFTGANRAVVLASSIDTLEYFLQNTPENVQQRGFRPASGNAREVFSDNRLQLPNMVYDDAMIDQSEGIRYFFGTERYVRYIDTIRYTGFGTLTTPEGTYTNVPMVQRNTSVSISILPQGPFQVMELYKEWEWYLPGYGFPYVRYGEEIYDYSFPEFAVVNYLGYVGFVEPLGARKPHLQARSLSVVPNPAGRLSRIELAELAPGQRSTLQWIDMQGRLVHSAPNMGKSVVLPDLKTGLYTLCVKTATDVFRTRVVIE